MKKLTWGLTVQKFKCSAPFIREEKQEEVIESVAAFRKKNETDLNARSAGK